MGVHSSKIKRIQYLGAGKRLRGGQECSSFFFDLTIDVMGYSIPLLSHPIWVDMYL